MTGGGKWNKTELIDWLKKRGIRADKCKGTQKTTKNKQTYFVNLPFQPCPR